MRSGYVLAGFRVVTHTDRKEWHDPTLPSTGLVSLSECCVEVVPADPIGWDTWFAGVQEAEAAREQTGRPNLHILAIGFAAADVHDLLDDLADDAGAGSLPDRLARREPLPASGVPLGFELIGYDTGRWHTWTCLGGLVAAVHQATDVRPGRHGLIQDEQDARRAAEWLTGSGLGEPKVYFWTAALMVDAGR